MINRKMIDDEISYLKKILEETEKSLVKLQKQAPVGATLRAAKHRGDTQYFLRSKSDKTNGTYIKKQDRRQAEVLAQIEYDNKLTNLLVHEIDELEKLYSIPTDNPYQSALDQVCDLKKELIQIPYINKEEFILQWLSQEYDKLEFREDAPEYYSKKGMRVRSKSEILISDILDEYEIPFLYEKPVKFKNGTTVHPDFTILDAANKREIIWEHFGMMDDIEYRNNAFGKIRLYESNGFYQGVNFIYTFETVKYPINSRNLRNMLITFQNRKSY
jgi:hypothetical protein